MDIVFIAILILSIVFHEVAHGYAAYLLGDPTAKLAGRLTLNPIKHIDPIGSIALPAFLILSSSSILFGWAKPVPYNPYNLKKGGRFAEAIVAFAGPATNILIAFFVLLAFKLTLIDIETALRVIYMNIFLAFINLIPVPPLDGSKVFPAFLPDSLRIPLERRMQSIESGGLFTMVIVLILLSLLAAEPIASLVYTISVKLLAI